MARTRYGTTCLLALVALSGLAVGQAGAQVQVTTSPRVATTGVPQRDTLVRLMRPVSAEFKEHRLEEVVKFIAELTGADIEAMWTDEQHPQGLDKEKPITLKVANISALKLIERVLEKANDDTNMGGNGWQMAEGGAIQIGPKVRLNKERRVEIYDISDLLLVVPDYTNAPQFDLTSVLSNTGGQGGGSGGQSPFRDNNQGTGAGGQGSIGGVTTMTREERARGVMDLLKELIETEQWADNGGDGATMKLYQGAIIINAPDYIHRQINGYPYWPASGTTSGVANGRRWVSLNGRTSINKLDGFAPHVVTGVVPGGGTGGGGGGGPPGGGG